MRRAAIVAAVLLLAMDTAASACHRFRVWNYPTPQQCRVTALTPRSAIRLPRTRINVRLVQTRLPARPLVPTPVIEIPIPSLADIDWGQPPDDDERGRLMLRGLLRKEDQ